MASTHIFDVWFFSLRLDTEDLRNYCKAATFVAENVARWSLHCTHGMTSHIDRRCYTYMCRCLSHLRRYRAYRCMRSSNARLVARCLLSLTRTHLNSCQQRGVHFTTQKSPDDRWNTIFTWRCNRLFCVGVAALRWCCASAADRVVDASVPEHSSIPHRDSDVTRPSAARPRDGS